MITVSVKQLVSAIEEADVFRLPDMTEGTEYIYDNLYRRLSGGEDIRLSEINFNCFETDDIDSMRELYSNTLEANRYKAETITHSLHRLSPITAAAFV